MFQRQVPDRSRTHPAPLRGTRTRPGFTLIELVVVLALLGILTGLLLAAVQRVRTAAGRVACASNLRQVALGVHMYESTRQEFPKGCDEAYSRALHSTPSPLGLSWHTTILPHVEQGPLWAQVAAAHREDPLGYSAAHTSILSRAVPVYLCPADGRPTAMGDFGVVYGLTGYRGVAGTGRRHDDGIFHIDFVVRPADVSDGLSNTVMIGERPATHDGHFGGWYAVWGYQVCPLSHILAGGPAGWVSSNAVGCPLRIPSLAPGRIDSDCSVGHFWSLHPGGANFAFADGSVRFISYSASEVLPSLATRSGGETGLPAQ